MRKRTLFASLLICSMATSYQAFGTGFVNIQVYDWTAADKNYDLYDSNNWYPNQYPNRSDTGNFNEPGAGVNPTYFFNPTLYSNSLYPGEFAFNSNNTFRTYVYNEYLNFYTNGITNNSGTNQYFIVADNGYLEFNGITSADSTESGKVFININDSECAFYGSSTASNANFKLTNSTLNFYDTSTADNAYIYLNDAGLYFKDASTIGSANIVAKNDSGILQYNSNQNSTPSIQLFSKSTLILNDEYYYGNLQVSKLDGDPTTSIKIYNTANLTVNNTEDCTFAGAYQITSSSSRNAPKLTKLGSGTFTLSGDNKDPKEILVQEGTLHLASAQPFNSAGLEEGVVFVRDKGTLSGNSIIYGLVAVFSGGTISPGDSIGMVEVKGPPGAFYLGYNGTYACEVDPTGASDLIYVNNTTLGNLAVYGTLAISDIGGRLVYHNYKILQSNGSIVGQFANITDTNPLVIDVVDYSDPQNTYLWFKQNLIVAAQTSNQVNVANALDSITNPSADELSVLNALINLPVSDAKHAFDDLSGEQYTYLIQIDRYGNERLNRRIYNAVRSTLVPCWCTDPCATVQTWFQVEEGQSYAHRDCNANGLRSLNWDFSLGMFAPLCNGFLVGAAINYQIDRVHFYQGGHTNWQTGQAAIYGAYQNDCGYVFADFIYGSSWGTLKRDMNFGNISRTAKSDPKTQQGLIYAEVGVNYNWCEVLFQPFAAVEFGFYDQRRINECGANSLDLYVQKKSLNTTDTYLGTHVTTYWNCFTVSADLAWQYRFDNSAINLTNGFQDFGDEFEIKGVRLGKNGVKAAIDISTKVSEAVTLYAEFSGERWKNWGAYGIDLGIGVWW